MIDMIHDIGDRVVSATHNPGPVIKAGDSYQSAFIQTFILSPASSRAFRRREDAFSDAEGDYVGEFLRKFFHRQHKLG
jgi:hypothetical protein